MEPSNDKDEETCRVPSAQVAERIRGKCVVARVEIFRRRRRKMDLGNGLDVERVRSDVRARKMVYNELGTIKKTRNTLDCKTAASSNILIVLSPTNTGVFELRLKLRVERKACVSVWAERPSVKAQAWD